jgi:hypothetical protein
MLVCQRPERAGEQAVCVADLLFTREQFQEIARVMGMPALSLNVWMYGCTHW